MASTGSTHAQQVEQPDGGLGPAEVSLWSTTNWASTTGILSAKGTPFSTRTGLIAG